MPESKITPDQHDFPKGIAQPALRALFGSGYTRLAQLTKMTEVELMALHGMGPKAMRLIKAEMKRQGLALARPK